MNKLGASPGYDAVGVAGHGPINEVNQDEAQVPYNDLPYEASETPSGVMSAGAGIGLNMRGSTGLGPNNSRG